MSSSSSIVGSLGGFAHKLAQVWTRIWFEPAPTTPLEIARIGVGFAIFFHYAMATPYLFMFWGDTEAMPRAIALQYLDGPWMQSLHYYFSAPWQWVAFHAVFLAAAAALVVGWRTSWVKWIVLVGHISYDYRNLTLSYGAQSIAASLLLLLCFAPIGRSLSLDRVREARRAKQADLSVTLPRFVSPWAGACTRMMQLQMAVLFFYSGVEKVRGDEWWNGDAAWHAFTTTEFFNEPIVWLMAHQYWLVNVMTYGTILIEIAYPFLIWQRSSRPYLLASALFLHASFMVGLGLVYFSFLMMMGHMSFVFPDWLARLGAWWKRKIGSLEMIYDGRCSFCVRSMAALLAFDGIGQIKVRDFRTEPTSLVSNEKLEKALYLLTGDGRAIPGFEAYRHIALRVPGLWWMVPLFYIPIFSRRVGVPLYDWIATNRNRLSATCGATAKSA